MTQFVILEKAVTQSGMNSSIEERNTHANKT